jgi:hypothetical protein
MTIEDAIKAYENSESKKGAIAGVFVCNHGKIKKYFFCEWDGDTTRSKLKDTFQNMARQLSLFLEKENPEDVQIPI